MSAYVGVYSILAAMPIWEVVFIGLVVGYALPFLIADRTVGLFFNYSYSGMLGDIGLFTVILVGIEVVRQGLPLPAWFSSILPQTAWLVLCVAAGIFVVVTNIVWPTDTLPNRYHNGVVAPLFLFFAPLMLLATFSNGSRFEIVVSVLLVAVWVSLVIYDYRSGRIKQNERLAREFGIHVILGRFQRLP